jgi:putative ABC transport system permease protein
MIADLRLVLRSLLYQRNFRVVNDLLGGFGIAAPVALSRFLSAFLPALPGSDPLALAGIIVVLTGAAALACGLPARRATRVDPLTALRAE